MRSFVTTLAVGVCLAAVATAADSDSSYDRAEFHYVTLSFEGTKYDADLDRTEALYKLEWTGDTSGQDVSNVTFDLPGAHHTARFIKEAYTKRIGSFADWGFTAPIAEDTTGLSAGGGGYTFSISREGYVEKSVVAVGVKQGEVRSIGQIHSLGYAEDTCDRLYHEAQDTFEKAEVYDLRDLDYVTSSELDSERSYLALSIESEESESRDETLQQAAEVRFVPLHGERFGEWATKLGDAGCKDAYVDRWTHDGETIKLAACGTPGLTNCGVLAQQWEERIREHTPPEVIRPPKDHCGERKIPSCY